MAVNPIRYLGKRTTTSAILHWLQKSWTTCQTIVVQQYEHVSFCNRDVIRVELSNPVYCRQTTKRKILSLQWVHFAFVWQPHSFKSVIDAHAEPFRQSFLYPTVPLSATAAYSSIVRHTFVSDYKNYQKWKIESLLGALNIRLR
jgi:hypothetical protein